MKNYTICDEIKEYIGACVGNKLYSFGEDRDIDQYVNNAQQMLNKYADEYNQNHTQKVEIIFNKISADKCMIEGNITISGEGAEEFKRLYNL